MEDDHIAAMIITGIIMAGLVLMTSTIKSCHIEKQCIKHSNCKKMGVYK